MASISHLLIAKSDQVNASDLIGIEKIFTVTSVDVPAKKSTDPLVVHYDGENGRPWKITSVTVMRLLQKLWTDETENWIGHSVAVHCDESVVWAGEEVGGVRPHAVTGIETTQVIKLRERKGGKPKTFEIKPLRIEKKGPVRAVVQFSMDNYTRAIEKILSESKDHDELSARFDRMADWRKQAAQTDRDTATELRQRVETRLAELNA